MVQEFLNNIVILFKIEIKMSQQNDRFFVYKKFFHMFFSGNEANHEKLSKKGKISMKTTTFFHKLD